MATEITSIANVEQDLQEQLGEFIRHCKDNFSEINKMPILYFILFFGFLLYQTFIGESILKYEYSIIEYMINQEVTEDDSNDGILDFMSNDDTN